MRVWDVATVTTVASYWLVFLTLASSFFLFPFHYFYRRLLLLLPIHFISFYDSGLGRYYFQAVARLQPETVAAWMVEKLEDCERFDVDHIRRIASKLFIGFDPWAAIQRLTPSTTTTRQPAFPEPWSSGKIASKRKRDDNDEDGDSVKNGWRTRLLRPTYPILMYISMELYRNQVDRAARLAGALEDTTGADDHDKRSAYERIFHYLLKQQQHHHHVRGGGEGGGLFYDPDNVGHSSVFYTLAPYLSRSGLAYFAQFFHELLARADDPSVGLTGDERTYLTTKCHQTLLLLLSTKYFPIAAALAYRYEPLSS